MRDNLRGRKRRLVHFVAVPVIPMPVGVDDEPDRLVRQLPDFGKHRGGRSRRAVGVEDEHAVGGEHDDRIAVEADVAVRRGHEEIDAFGHLHFRRRGPRPAVGLARPWNDGEEHDSGDSHGPPPCAAANRRAATVGHGVSKRGGEQGQHNSPHRQRPRQHARQDEPDWMKAATPTASPMRAFRRSGITTCLPAYRQPRPTPMARRIAWLCRALGAGYHGIGAGAAGRRSRTAQDSLPDRQVREGGLQMAHKSTVDALDDGIFVTEVALGDYDVRGVLLLGDARAVVWDTLSHPRDMAGWLPLIGRRDVMVVYSHADWDHIWGTAGLPLAGAVVAGQRACQARFAGDVPSTSSRAEARRAWGVG